jgi:hypothetical protein
MRRQVREKEAEKNHMPNLIISLLSLLFLFTFSLFLIVSRHNSTFSLAAVEPPLLHFSSSTFTP